MASKNLISIEDLSREDIESLFSDADDIRRFPESFGNALSGRIVFTLFCQPSTRTRLSFESAAYRLGARVLSVFDMHSTRQSLGESLLDTTRMAGYYADALIARHPDHGVMEQITETIDVPLINAGEGLGRHPTQTLIDLYTAREHFDTIDGLRVGFVGGLRYSRAAKSLLAGLKLFNNIELHAVDAANEADEGSPLPAALVAAAGRPIRLHASVQAMMGQVDLLYVVRVQREKFSDGALYQRQLDRCRVHRELLAKAPPWLAVMHCLPRTEELDTDVDATPQNKYFLQAAYGVPLRMAVLRRYMAHSSGSGGGGGPGGLHMADAMSRRAIEVLRNDEPSLTW
ncbi:aspartate carbamoyltransferase [Acidovorax sp. SUPP3334]|uniref:aspartate carbamoyltransferase n=1 Tax=Acidovorax sp. SUPP3334 TaxID=2920881 RepID=UPI0023DE6878|nr:aspartate carbamoyltransferase [Acidovorax sp. SUPP3334]GKT23402.1 aspartate carbamoyltransferase [Acidovorax sp. SUPP3334]